MDYTVTVPDDLATLTTEEALDAITTIAAATRHLDSIRQQLEVIATAEQQITAINERYVRGIGRADGDPWTQPVGAHDAHLQGAIVTHGGKIWESLIPANVWEPGVSGWREVVADDPDTGEPGVPDFVQPSGEHDAYQISDRMRFDGQVWESIIANNVWSPAAHAAGWKLIG